MHACGLRASPPLGEPAVGDIPLQPGTFLYGQGRSTPSGTGILSPDAQDGPGRKGTHPAARNVPVSVGGWPGDGGEEESAAPEAAVAGSRGA